VTIEVYQFVATVLFSLLMGSIAAATLVALLTSRSESVRERLAKLEKAQELQFNEVVKRLKNIETHLFPVPTAPPGGE